jgi:hypothetical protein
MRVILKKIIMTEFTLLIIYLYLIETRVYTNIWLFISSLISKKKQEGIK